MIIVFSYYANIHVQTAGKVIERRTSKQQGGPIKVYVRNIKVLVKCYEVHVDSSTLYSKIIKPSKLLKMGIDVTKCEEILSEKTITSLLSTNV